MMKQYLILSLSLSVLTLSAYAGKKADEKMWKAIKTHDIDLLNSAISDGADVNALDVNGSPVLNAAVIWPDMTAILIKAGADVNNPGKIDMPPLITAVSMGSAESVKALIDAGADVNYVQKNTGMSALHYGTWRSNCAKCVEYLIQAGANVNVQDNNKETPLTVMITASTPEDRVKTVQYTVNAYKAGGFEVLPERFTNPQLSDFDRPEEIMEVLLNADIDPNLSNKAGVNALMNAAYFNKVSLMEKLVDKGAKLKDKDKSGMTVFQHAIQGGAGDAVAYLVINGLAKVDEKFDWYDTRFGIEMKDMTALAVAALNGSPERVKALIDLGADCTVKSHGTFYHAGNPCTGKVKNKTPLIYAIESGNLELVKTLVETCSLPKIKASWNNFEIVPTNKSLCTGGKTWVRSYMYAEFLGYNDIADYLKSNNIM